MFKRKKSRDHMECLESNYFGHMQDKHILVCRDPGISLAINKMFSNATNKDKILNTSLQPVYKI